MTNGEHPAGAGRDEADLAPCRGRWTRSTSPTERAGQGASTSARTCAPCRPRASSPRRWSRSCWPTRAWRSSAATPWRRPPATSRLPRLDPRGAAVMVSAPRPARGADRAAGVGQDHRRPAARRRCSGCRCATPTRRRGGRRASHRRHLHRGRRGALPRAGAARGRRARWRATTACSSLGGGAVLDEADPGAARGPHRRLPAGRARRRRPAGRASTASRPLLALQPARRWVRLMEERRRIYERLAVLPRRHRRARARRGHRRRDRRPAGGPSA